MHKCVVIYIHCAKLVWRISSIIIFYLFHERVCVLRWYWLDVFVIFIFSVDTATAAVKETETPLKKIKDNTALLWRTLRIAVPFYLAVMILCSIGWLEPQCCDLQNNYKWSFALGLRYLNGPPPTWCVVHKDDKSKCNKFAFLPSCLYITLLFLIIIIAVQNGDGLGNHYERESAILIFFISLSPLTPSQKSQHS